MTSYPSRGSCTLSDSHRQQLEQSGIDPGVAAERPYYTARTRSEVPEAFKDYQRRPGLVIPVLTPSGERRVRLRPDRPRKGKDGRVRKYEQAGGVGCVLDVHPRNFERLQDRTVPLWIVEGEKKGDALTSRGECAIALPGVWNFQRSGEMLPDWDHAELGGRRVYVCFDSDAWSNSNVQLALERLVAALEERDAEVLVVHLEAGPDGSKVGADDFLASEEIGGSVAELKLRARKFVPEEIGRVRASKDEQLRAGLEDLERSFWAEEWKGMGGASARDVYLKLIEAAGRHGKVVEDGIRVVKAQGPLALEAKVSTRTLWKALNRLEEWRLIYRDNKDRKPDRSGAFVLRANVSHKGSGTAVEGNVTPLLQTYDPGNLHLRAPRLMWSSPGSRPKRGTVKGTRKVRQSPPSKPKPAIKRPGKIRGAVLDVLDAVERAGGTLTVEELSEAMHRKRPRDLTRRKKPGSKGRDGLAVMLMDAGIVSLDGDTIALTADWRERLDDLRRAGQEIDATVTVTLADGTTKEQTEQGAEAIARERMEIKRKAYHSRHETPKSRPSAAGLANIRVSREKRAAHTAEPRTRTDEQERRIAQLVREGMKRPFAEEEVYGRRAAPPQRSSDPRRRTLGNRRSLPPKVEGVYVHGAECDCWICSDSEAEGVA